jgi:hypothetical protein
MNPASQAARAMSIAEMIPELATKQTQGERTSLNLLWKSLQHRRYLPYLVFGLCASFYFLPFMLLLLRGFNEGTLDCGAVRILHGQLLGRDFFEVIGPGTFYWLALFFKLFGVTFLASRICLFVGSLLTVLSMYFLARRVCHRYQILPCILLFATYFDTHWPEVNYHIDSNCFALLAVVCMVLWQGSRKNWLLVTAGALAGATTLTLQPKGILLLLASLIWLSIQHWRRSASLTALIWVTGGWVAVVASVLGYFWSQRALHDLIYANVIWPSQNYGTGNTVPYAFGIMDHFHQWIAPTHGIHWTVGMAVVLFIPFLFVAVLPALVVPLAVREGMKAASAEITLYWLAGSALWISELHRKDISHLVFGSPLLILLCVFYLQKRPNKSFSLALQALSIAGVCLTGAALIIALVARPIQTRAGRVHMAAYDPALAAIEEYVAPGEGIFIYPYPPMEYFLSRTTNPTRYSLLAYNYNTPSQFQEVIRSLEQHQVKYVLWNKKIAEEILPGLYPGEEPKQRIMELYLGSHYRPVWADDGAFLMKRNDDETNSEAVVMANATSTSIRGSNGALPATH